eukprot:g385.t1
MQTHLEQSTKTRDLKISTASLDGVTELLQEARNAEYVIDDEWLAANDNDIQALIEETQAGDTIYFEVSSKVVTPKRTLTIDHPLNLVTRSDGTTGTLTPVGFVTVLTCPSKGPLIDIEGSEIVFKGFGIRLCTEAYRGPAAVIISPSFGASFDYTFIADNKVKVFQIKNNAVMNMTNSYATANKGKAGSVFSGLRGTLDVTNTSFVENKVKTDGAVGFFTDSFAATFTDCTFIKNGGNGAKGGCFRNLRNAVTTLTSSEFTENFGNNGGVLRAEGGSFTIDKCTFTSNKAYADGGVMNSWAGGKFYVTDSEFTKNKGMNAGVGYIGKECVATFLNCQFEKNNVVDNGGVLRVQFNAKATVDDSLFLRNRCDRGDGASVYIGRNSTTVARNCNFTENNAKFKGGAFGIYEDSRLEVSDSVFLSNRATHGGAVRIEAAAFADIVRCTFVKNTAEIDGGTINLWIFAAVSIVDSSITDSEGRDGGAIFVGAMSNVQMERSNVTYSTATETGGGIGVFAYCTINLTDSIFQGNVAGDAAGAYLAGYTHVDISGCKFISNTARGKGGGIWAFYSETMRITNTLFKLNDAYEGGGVYNEGEAVVTITGSDFVNNTAQHDTAALFIMLQGQVTVTDTVFEKNYAHHHGGAVISAVQCTTSFQSCRFSDNEAHVDGAGVVIFNESRSTFADSIFEGNQPRHDPQTDLVTNVSGCTFRDNSAWYEGAALVVFYRSLFTVVDTKFTNNSAGLYGGGFRIHVLAETVATNCAFDLNTAGEDGGAFSVFNGSSLYLADSTLTRQSSNKFGGSINVQDGSKINITTTNITDSSSVDYGGCVSLFESEATVSKLNMKNCTSAGPGTSFAAFDSKIYYNGKIFRTETVP